MFKPKGQHILTFSYACVMYQSLSSSQPPPCVTIIITTDNICHYHHHNHHHLLRRPPPKHFFSQQKKRNGKSNVNSNSSKTSQLLCTRNRDPPPANTVDFDTIDRSAAKWLRSRDLKEVRSSCYTHPSAHIAISTKLVLVSLHFNLRPLTKNSTLVS